MSIIAAPERAHRPIAISCVDLGPNWQRPSHRSESNATSRSRYLSSELRFRGVNGRSSAGACDEDDKYIPAGDLNEIALVSLVPTAFMMVMFASNLPPSTFVPQHTKQPLPALILRNLCFSIFRNTPSYTIPSSMSEMTVVTWLETASSDLRFPSVEDVAALPCDQEVFVEAKRDHVSVYRKL